MRWHALGTMALAGLALGGCYATTTTSGPMYEPAPPPPVYAAQPAAPVYRYFGPHPIPLSLGGGWCWIEGAHDHEYLISEPRHFTYVGGVYRYVGPYNCSFSGQHPVAGGGWCYINYPHSHDYCPSPEYRSYYQWDRVHHAYTYQSNGHQATPAYGNGYHAAEPAYGAPGYHGAQPVNGSPGYHGAEPAYGAPGYHGAQPVSGSPGYGNGAHGAEPAYGNPGSSNTHGASAPGYVAPSYGGHGATAPGNVATPPTVNGAHGATAPGSGPANGPPGQTGNHPVAQPAWGIPQPPGQMQPHPVGNPGANNGNPHGNGNPGAHPLPPGQVQPQGSNNFHPPYPGNKLPDPHVVNRPTGAPGMSHAAPVHGMPQQAQPQNPNQNQHHDENNNHGHGAHGVKK